MLVTLLRSDGLDGGLVSGVLVDDKELSYLVLSRAICKELVNVA